jgi:hypothetical protein
LITEKCNGHRRSAAQKEGLYNPQGVWYYLKQLQDKGKEMVPRMDPNVVQPSKDEIAAFLVKHAAAAKAYSPLHFIEGVIPFTPLLRFSAESLFDKKEGSTTAICLLYPRDDMHRDCLVPPNEDTKEIFVDAFLAGLPNTYRQQFDRMLTEKKPLLEALRDIYNAAMTGQLPM